MVVHITTEIDLQSYQHPHILDTTLSSVFLVCMMEDTQMHTVPVMDTNKIEMDVSAKLLGEL